jgi:hypothetical protein
MTTMPRSQIAPTPASLRAGAARARGRVAATADTTRAPACDRAVLDAFAAAPNR